MSDFLQRLARRSVGPAEDVEPRLPTRFEPLASRIGVAAPGAVDDLESVATPATAPDEQPAPPRARRPQTRLPRPTAARPGGQSVPDGPPDDTADAAPSVVPRRDRRAARPSGPPPARERDPDTPQERPAPAPVARRPSVDAGRATAPALSGGPIDGSADRRPGRPDRRSGPPLPLVAGDEERIRRPAVAQPRLPAAPPEPPPRPAVAPQVPPALDRASVRSGFGPMAPPTIEVSIGRVDVRAVFTPPPPVPPPVQAGPTMQLDDYLERRDGGRL